MSKKQIGLGLCFVLLLLVVFTTRENSIPKKKAEEIQKPKMNISSVPILKQSPVLKPVSNKSKSLGPKVLTANQKTNAPIVVKKEWSSETIKQLESLKQSYRPGGLPSRIRIHDQLSKLFAAQLPSVEQMFSLISDADAPEEYRIYFAKVLRNQIKRRAYNDNELSVAIERMQNIVRLESDAALFRSKLAMILTTVDQSDKTIQTVLPLLKNVNDETAARAVAALCNTTSPLAVESLYNFVQNYADLQQTKPNALASALAPLSTVKNYDIVPIVQDVLSSTDNFDLMRTSLQCLIRVPSSQSVVEAVVTAYDSSNKMPPQKRSYLHFLCRTTLKKHSKFIQKNKSVLNQVLIEKIQQIKESK